MGMGEQRERRRCEGEKERMRWMDGEMEERGETGPGVGGWTREGGTRRFGADGSRAEGQEKEEKKKKKRGQKRAGDKAKWQRNRKQMKRHHPGNDVNNHE
jgi:hypothetical protein